MTRHLNPRVCIVSLSNFSNDPRVLKQVRTSLDLGYRVTAIGKGKKGTLPDEVRFVSVAPAGMGKKMARAGGDRRPSARQLVVDAVRWFKRLALFTLLALGRILPLIHPLLYTAFPGSLRLQRLLLSADCDFFVANDIGALPAVVRGARAAPILYDAHEYAPEQHAGPRASHLLRNRHKRALCLRYIPRVSKMITVSEGIAELYERDTGILPEVIRNVPYYRPTEFRPTDLSMIRMIHHGAAIPQRRLEVMIDALASLPERFSLTFMLTRPDSRSEHYVEALRERAERIVGVRILFRDPVPLSEVHAVLEEYDVGFFVRPVGNTHRRFALPNKLFQFIMAGLCVVIGPSPEMARVVREHRCGVVAPSYDPEEVAKVLEGLCASEIDEYKRAALTAAKELNAEKETAKLAELLAELAAEAAGQRAATQGN